MDGFRWGNVVRKDDNGQFTIGLAVFVSAVIGIHLLVKRLRSYFAE